MLWETPTGEMGMILSIGLNVNMQPDDARTINQPATSLKIEEGRNFDVAKITQNLQNNLIEDLATLTRSGFSVFYDEIAALMIKKNERVYFHNSDGKRHWQGIFSAFNKDGSISIELDDGTKRTFHSGEMTLFPVAHSLK